MYSKFWCKTLMYHQPSKLEPVRGQNNRVLWQFARRSKKGQVSLALVQRRSSQPVVLWALPLTTVRTTNPSKNIIWLPTSQFDVQQANLVRVIRRHLLWLTQLPMKRTMVTPCPVLPTFMVVRKHFLQIHHVCALCSAQTDPTFGRYTQSCLL